MPAPVCCPQCPPLPSFASSHLPTPYLQSPQCPCTHGQGGKGVQAVVPISWEFVSLEEEAMREALPSSKGPSVPITGPRLVPLLVSATVVAQEPSPPSVLAPAHPHSRSYQLCSQLPSVGQEGTGQEHGAVQLSPRVWGGSRRARWRPWGSSSIWPQAQCGQDQAANTWDRSRQRTQAGATGLREEGCALGS